MKNFLTGPRIIGALVMAALALSLAVLLRSPPVEVAVGVASQGPMAVSVEDLGESRVTDLYTVSAPITGELLRVGLKPGAKVVANQTVLARILFGVSAFGTDLGLRIMEGLGLVAVT